MPLQNIVGMVLPLGLAIAVGAIVLGLFYRERNQDYSYSDFTGSDFCPDARYDTADPRSSRKKKEEEDECCIICFDSIKRSQTIRVLQCAHKFHRKCINEWLRFEMFCPMCRSTVVN